MAHPYVTIRTLHSLADASVTESILGGHGFSIMPLNQAIPAVPRWDIRVAADQAAEADAFLKAVLVRDETGQLTLVRPEGGELSQPDEDGSLTLAGTRTHCKQCGEEWETALGACWSCLWQPELAPSR
jgi:hypothetical protein